MASATTGGAATAASPRAHKLLPDQDDQPVRNSLEPYQGALLTQSLTPLLQALHPDGDFYIGQDTGIYWRRTEPPLQGCKSPDWYVVEGVPHLLDGEYRRSYVLWEEEEPPLLVVEYASGDGTEERDRTRGEGKFWVYERRIQAGYYAIYEPDRPALEVYQRVGIRFRRMAANERDRYPITELGIELGLWQGSYGGYELPWLRAWDQQGRLLFADAERAAQAQELAERMAAKLRELGVDPATL
jgi:Uma2 family endonuclease